jgi:hypothetical protein
LNWFSRDIVAGGRHRRRRVNRVVVAAGFVAAIVERLAVVAGQWRGSLGP